MARTCDDGGLAASAYPHEPGAARHPALSQHRKDHAREDPGEAEPCCDGRLGHVEQELSYRAMVLSEDVIGVHLLGGSLDVVDYFPQPEEVRL